MPRQERLSVEDHVLSARLACAEFLLNGVTCIADRLGNMDDIAPAIEATGIRAVVGDRSSMPRPRRTGRRGRRLRALRHRPAPARLRGHRAARPRHLLRRSPEGVRAARRKDRRARLHPCRTERAGGRGGPAARPRRRARLSGRDGSHDAQHRRRACDLSHAAEFDAWPGHGISIAHCPASNLKIEASTPPLERLVGRVPVGLGTDWTATNNAMDLLAEARLAALVGKMRADDPEVLPVRRCCAC